MIFDQGMFVIDPNATPEQVARKRAAIAALMPRYGQARSVGEGIGQLATGILAGRQGRKLDRAEATGTANASDLFNRLLSGAGTQAVPQYSGGASQPYQAPVADPNSPLQLGRDAMAAIGKPANNGLSAPAQIGMDAMAAMGKPNNLTPQQMVIAGATQRGLDPLDVATAMSYETGGTMDPLQRGPTTQWGTHEGLIQFGDPQGVQHGAVFDQGPDAAMRSQLDPQNGAVWSYLDGTGVQPGMGLDNIYSAINAGAPGRFNASDANNGGAPGTVADKVAGMGDHRNAAMAWLGMEGQQQPQGSVTLSTQGAPVQPQPQGGPSMEELYGALANPWLNDQQRGVVATLIQQQTQASDPIRAMEMERSRLELDALRNPQAPSGVNVGGALVNPQTGEVMYQAPMQPNGGAEYGLNPIYGRDAEGNPVVMQLGKDGTAVVTAMPDGMSPDLAIAAQQRAQGTEEGKAAGERVANAPTVVANADIAFQGINEILSHPGIDDNTGFWAMANFVPGTQGYAFQKRVEQLAGGAFLTAIQQLQGMGALSNAEGSTATAALARLDTGLGPEEFKDALADYQAIVQAGVDRANSAMGGADAPAAPPTRKRYNPQTGAFE